MFEQKHQCGKCHIKSNFPFFNIGRYKGEAGKEVPADELGIDGNTHDQKIVKGFGLAHCPHCGIPTLFLFESEYRHIISIKEHMHKSGILFGQNAFFKNVEAYPKAKVAVQDPNWPDNLRRQFADAQDMLWEGKTPSIILATARTVLELALKELDDTTDQTLYKRIETLHSNGIITTPIKDWAHDIRLDGNDATHDGIGEEEMAKEYIEFLKLFLNMTFSLPKRIEEKRKFSDVK